MASINHTSIDLALADIRTATDTLHICVSEPANYGAVAAASRGTKASPTIGTPEAGAVDGRRITISAISDGSVSSDGTVTHWALTREVVSEERLLATGTLESSQAVTNGNSFTLTSFSVTIRDPA
jgi:hypothetical protein